MPFANQRCLSIVLPVAVMCLGCAEVNGDVPTLEGAEWVLEVVETPDGSVHAAAGSPAVLTFTGEPVEGGDPMLQLRGSGGCNRFFGGYALDGAGGLTVTELGSTRMMCPDSVMAAEDALLTNLPRATSYVVSGSELVLETEGGKLRFGLVKP